MAEQVIGILGGMGPEATLSLFEKIIANTPATRDQDHLRVVIDSNAKIPDRTPAILGQGNSPVPAMVESGRALERAGADFIVIPCVSAHFFLDELQAQLALPILSLFDAVAEEVERQQPVPATVGLLATTGTIHGAKFQERLQKSGMDTLVPGLDDQKRVMSVIYRIKATSAGAGRDDMRSELRSVVAALVDRGAQAIVAGCTEIPLVLRSQDVLVPFLDSLVVLARAAIVRAGRRPFARA
ncbi:MAG TPA: amino acid racemase [Syntrophobacteria bacterium]|nr:amino acid racemase [Syntrophobacteria bacterium]